MRLRPIVRVKSREKENMGIVLNFPKECAIIFKDVETIGPSLRDRADQLKRREIPMTHVQTLNGATLKQSAAHGGCGECQTSCQSACKTSCTVANQKCENRK